MTAVLSGVRCQNCRRPVVWDRVGTYWQLIDAHRKRAHHCPPICGALLPIAGDRCARMLAHSGSHRSRWAMDNDARARSGATQIRPKIVEKYPVPV